VFLGQPERLKLKMEAGHIMNRIKILQDERGTETPCGSKVDIV
jgi:hypothetical protein